MADTPAESIEDTPGEPIPTKDRPAKLPVNVAELRRRLGQRQAEPIHVVLSHQEVVSSRTTARPVVGEVTIESIERGVSVTGSIRFAWEGDCRRCLELTGSTMEFDIHEIFQVDAPEDSDLLDFDGDQIDLLPLVREAVLFSLPLAPLCGEDCAGPDPDRYPARRIDDFLEAQEAERAAAGGDPRWAALDDLTFDDD